VSAQLISGTLPVPEQTDGVYYPAALFFGAACINRPDCANRVCASAPITTASVNRT